MGWGAIGPERQWPGKRKLFRDGSKLLRELLHIQLKPVEVPVHTRAIESFIGNLVLLKMKNIAVMLIDETSDGGIESPAVRTLHQENCAIFQNRSPDPVNIRLNF